MPGPDLSRLSHEEKDALILALLERVAALEAKLNPPPKTPDNSSLPPSRGQKANRPPQPFGFGAALARAATSVPPPARP